MPLRSIHRYIQRVRQQTDSTLQYVRLSLQGNVIERKCNFSKMRRPILLLQGYGASRRVFNLLEARLRKDGFSVFSLNLGGLWDKFNTDPIPHLAHHISQKVDNLYKRHRIKEKLIIIGHSKGGLVGRCYLKDYQGHRRVQKLITLATPHNGNPWAMIGLVTPLGLVTRSLSQMAPISSFIRRMKKTPWPKGVEIVSIFSRGDVVAPYPSPVLAVSSKIKRIRNIEIDDIGHAEFLVNRKVYNVIRNEILERSIAVKRLPTRRSKRT